MATNTVARKDLFMILGLWLWWLIQIYEIELFFDYI